MVRRAALPQEAGKYKRFTACYCSRTPTLPSVLFLLLLPLANNQNVQGSRKFRQELGRAVQAQSKVDPDTDAFREAVEQAMALIPEEALDEPVGDTPDDARGAHVLEA